MLPFEPRSARQVQEYYTVRYQELIASGEKVPFIYPWGSAGAAIVIAYLLIDHRKVPWLRSLSFPVWLLNFAISLWTILHCKARTPASAFGVGLISCWSILWTSTLLVWNDCQTHFKRIEREEGAMRRSFLVDEANGRPVLNGIASRAANADLRPRKLATVKPVKGPTQRTGLFAWQTYPVEPFIERLDWVLDIFCNFRGMGWNWRISSLPPPPEWVQKQLHSTSHTDSEAELSQKDRSKDTHVIHRYHDKHILLWSTARDLVFAYVIIDILKTLVVNDAYFWTGSHASPAPAYFPLLVAQNPVLLQSYRLSATLAAIYIFLWAIFKLGPAFFCAILGPELIGARGELWMYPDAFGSVVSVLDKGLAGWWGGWWHQTFRSAFEAPTTGILHLLGVEKRSKVGKAIGLFVAFFLSGCLHACGSYTQTGDTYPFAGPMSFFLLQAVAILAQTQLSDALRARGLSQHLPTWLTRLSNFIVVHMWLYHTAPLLVDDFARGGLWLFEPIPISLLRGLGLGGKEEGWFCWSVGTASWHTGEHWWTSGLAL